MLILAFDTTAITASVAIAEIDGGNIKRYALYCLKNKLTHSENLVPMVEEVFDRFKCNIEDIDRIAVSVGPGSFTGVRIGVATVKGMAMQRDIPCAAVSTLEALGRNITPTGIYICPVMDARRERFYNAIFDGGGNKVCDDRIISSDNLIDELTERGERFILCGDGAVLFKSKFPEYRELILASEISLNQNALSVALCGYDKETISSEMLRPIYLRPSQAEREALKNKTVEENK